MIVYFNSHELFGMSEDDMMLHIKHRFYNYGVKINLKNPDINKSLIRDIKENKKVHSVKEKKEHIKKILKNKKLKM